MEHAASELRFDPLRRAWVIIAGERGHAPRDFLPAPQVATDEPCPFCLMHAGTPDVVGPVIAERVIGDDRVVAVANKFPALAAVDGAVLRRGRGPYDRVSGVGAHEVIIETRAHDHDLADLSVPHLAGVLSVWRDRIRDLYKDRRVHYVTAYRNRGLGGGSSLRHPHSQLLASPVLPGRVKAELAAACAHYQAKLRCLICDIVADDLRGETRLVTADDRFVAACPYASRQPFEVVVYPRQHAHDFAGLTDGDAHALAGVVREVLGRQRRALSSPDYNLALHTAPSTQTFARPAHELADLQRFWHWRLEIVPRLGGSGGFELASGMHMNPTRPGDAAAHLRSLAD